MYLNKLQREEFAKNIISLTGLTDSYEGDKFFDHLRDMHEVKFSNYEYDQNKIMEWLKDEKKEKEIRDLIKDNYSNPRVVLDYLKESVKI